jgi:hypothetical protein
VTCKLSTGFTVEIVRLRTRQFFRLLKVLTHGAGPALMRTGLDFRTGGEEFASKLIMLVVMSIPDAEQEAIGFLQSMCKPHGLTDKPESQLTKQQAEDNKKLWDDFNTELFNPDPSDTLDLIEQIMLQEAPELQALGKKLQKMLEMFTKTGQGAEAKEPDPTPAEMAASPGPSAPPSTSSPASTDGPTSTSSTSPSAGSGRSSKPRQPAAAASK